MFVKEKEDGEKGGVKAKKSKSKSKKKSKAEDAKADEAVPGSEEEPEKKRAPK